MKVRSERNEARATEPMPDARRFWERVADFLSPTLECGACGAQCKQRRCRRTGNVRAVAASEGWPSVTASEVEYECPSCGESIWELDAPAYYYPIG